MSMTVAEVIEQLSRLPGDLNVEISTLWPGRPDTIIKTNANFVKQGRDGTVYVTSFLDPAPRDQDDEP